MPIQLVGRATDPGELLKARYDVGQTSVPNIWSRERTAVAGLEDVCAIMRMAIRCDGYVRVPTISFACSTDCDQWARPTDIFVVWVALPKCGMIANQVKEAAMGTGSPLSDT